MDAAFYAADLTRFVRSQGESSSLQLGIDGSVPEGSGATRALATQEYVDSAFVRK